MFEHGIIGYHHLFVHFPTALWFSALALMVLRAASDRPLAQAAETLLIPVLLLGALAGIVSFVSGFYIWPYETVATTPLGRNKLLWAAWTLAFWVVIALVYIRGRTVLWQGYNRFLMPFLGLVGVWMLSITGGLGGHLGGDPTAWSAVLAWFGWDIYRTFFMPTPMLLVTLLASILIIAIAVIHIRMRRREV